MTTAIATPEAFLDPDEPIGEHICQNGVTPGKLKLQQFVKACMLRGVPPLYSTEDIPQDQKIAYVKLFDPCGSWTWYITEYSRKAPDGYPHMAFGLVVGDEIELSYIALEELSEVKGAMGIGIEIDCWWKPTRLCEIKDTRD